MKEQKYSVAPYKPPPPPNWVSPDGGNFYADGKPPRPTVSHTESNAAPMPTLLVVLAADVAIGALLFLGLHYAVRLDPGAAFLLAMFAVLCLTTFAIAFLSGQLPALFEIRAARRTDEQHIASQERLWDRWLGILDTQAQAEHTEAQAKLIAAQNEQATIEHAMLTARADAQTHSNQLATYTGETYVDADPTPDPAYTEVLRFVGEKLFANIDGEGRIKCAVPWGRTGGLSNADAARVVEWLETVNNHHGELRGWVIQYRPEKAGWYVNHKAYESAWHVHRALKAKPLLKRQG